MKNLLAHRSGKLSLHVANLNTFCSTPNKATNFTRKHANINKLVAIFGPGSLFHCSDAGDKNRIFSEIPLWQIGKTWDICSETRVSNSTGRYNYPVNLSWVGDNCRPRRMSRGNTNCRVFLAVWLQISGLDNAWLSCVHGSMLHFISTIHNCYTIKQSRTYHILRLSIKTLNVHRPRCSVYEIQKRKLDALFEFVKSPHAKGNYFEGREAKEFRSTRLFRLTCIIRLLYSLGFDFCFCAARSSQQLSSVTCALPVGFRTSNRSTIGICF